jgi:formate hydrogenlyase subunit 4
MKQMLLFTLGVDIFFPAGITGDTAFTGLGVSFVLYFLKMCFMAVLMAAIESTRAKLRFFQLPSLLGGAFVLAFLSLLTYIMMGR